MTDRRDNINLAKSVFDEKIEKENREPVWDKPVADLELCLCPNLL